MKINEYLQNLLYSFFSKALSEKDKIWDEWASATERTFYAEVLKIGIFNTMINNSFKQKGLEQF